MKIVPSEVSNFKILSFTVALVTLTFMFRVNVFAGVQLYVSWMVNNDGRDSEVENGSVTLWYGG